MGKKFNVAVVNDYFISTRQDGNIIIKPCYRYVDKQYMLVDECEKAALYDNFDDACDAMKRMLVNESLSNVHTIILETFKETEMTACDFPGLDGLLDKFEVRIVRDKDMLEIFAMDKAEYERRNPGWLVTFDSKGSPVYPEEKWDMQICLERNVNDLTAFIVAEDGVKSSLRCYKDAADKFPKENGCWDPNTYCDWDYLCTPGICNQHTVFTLLVDVVNVADKVHKLGEV